MKQPKVSIIIPIYNVENYLEECLNSAIMQNYENKEIIAINDGSTDSSLCILNKIKHVHPELIIVSTTNQGQSSARNTGLDRATGEYIIFLDSDDWIQPSTLKLCIKTITDQQVDIVMFSANAFAHEFPNCNISDFNYNHPLSLLNKKILSKEYFYQSISQKNYIVQPCMYLYNKKKLGSVRFLPGITHEDNLFTTNLLLKRDDSTVTCIPDKLYNRRIRPDSIMTKKKNDDHINGYFSVAENLLLITSTGEKKHITKALITFTQNMIISAIESCRIAYNNRFPRNFRVRSIELLSKLRMRDIKVKSIAFVVVPELTILKAYLKKKFKKHDPL